MINILLMENLNNEAWCYSTFKKYIHKDMSVLVIPFTFNRTNVHTKEDVQKLYAAPNGFYYHSMMQCFLDYDIPIEQIHWLNYFDNNDKQNAKKLVNEADIIYFPGGLPDQLKERLIEFDLVTTLENFKGIMIGFSAGAMIQLKSTHITPDKDYPDYFYMEGLNIFDDFDIEVHYENTDIQNECINKALREKQLPVYAIGDKGALLIDNGKKIILGDVQLFKGKEVNV